MTDLTIKNLLSYCLSHNIALCFNKRDNNLELTVPNHRVFRVLLGLHRNFQFKQLTDIRTIHYTHSNAQVSRDSSPISSELTQNLQGVDATSHYRVIYQILSIETNIRLKVNTYTDTRLPSVVDLYPRASWMEREIWDMFGILFLQNNKHRIQNRILTDYGFKGHPLRKDFPESGFNEVLYDEESKRVITIRSKISMGT